MIKQVIISALIILAAVVLLIPSCSSVEIITGSGPVETRDYDLSDFTSVTISSAFEFELVPASTYSIAVTANENLFSYIEVNKSGDTLSIGLQRYPINLGDATLEASVALPELVKLDISGASRGTALGFNTAGDFRLKVSGASELQTDLTADKVDADISGASQLGGTLMAPEIDLELSGASQLNLTGTTENAVVYISGASKATLPDFPIRNGYFNLSGASRAVVNVSNKLDADLSGASNLEYLGNPTMGEINISDACRIGRY
jgi:hypothetical protein